MLHHRVKTHVKQYGRIYGPLALALVIGLVWYGTQLTWGVGPQNAHPTPPDRPEDHATAEVVKEQDDGLPDKFLIANVPFTSQAPSAQWDDDRFQNACEEASILMATSWLKGESIGTAADATNKLIELSELSEAMFGTHVDTSAADSFKLFQRYAGVTTGSLKYDPTLLDIKRELAAGHILLAPMNGQALDNPNFTGAGPERHFIVIIGYDDNTGMFTTNDPGTRNGRNYRYKYATLFAAMRDYPTGDHQEIKSNRRAMIVVTK